MDGQQYLNQISPVAAKHSKLPKFLQNPIAKVLTLGVLGLIVILIIGAMLSGGSKTENKSGIFVLRNDLSELSRIVTTYKPNVRSASSQQNTNSLLSVLASSTRSLTGYIAENVEEPETPVEDTSFDAATLEHELFSAATGQSFDHAYARKIALAISSIMTNEKTIYDSTSNTDLKNLLSTSYNSLATIYDNFNNYSE